MAYRPLADEIRPKTLDEVVGQKHILGKDGLLRRIIEGGRHPQPDLLRPLWDGEDHGGQHHRPAHQPPPPPAQRHHRPPFLILRTLSQISGPSWPRTGCCCTWTRSSTLTKSSSSPCWSSWRTGRSPSSPPPPRTPSSTCSGRCCPDPPCLSSSRLPPRTPSPPLTGEWTCSMSGWAGTLFWRTGCGSTSPPPAAGTSARP